MKGAPAANGDFTADNIIMSKVKELTDADQQELEAQKLEFEKLFVTRFKKMRQGAIMNRKTEEPSGEVS